MEDSRHIERIGRLSDMVRADLLDPNSVFMTLEL